MKFKKLGKYILLEQMATGGMAEIHLAIESSDNGIHKFFAIKKILTAYSGNDEFIHLFENEAKIISQLNHSNIINIFDFGIDKDNQLYIVMEFVHGKNLKQVTQVLENENRKLPVEFIAYIIKNAATGLDYAHSAIHTQSGQPLNIIHRDVSPQNIMISYDGEIKVIDFGIANSVSERETADSGLLKGKFGYMSPEQVVGERMDNRTDLFSLGVIMWELLANKRLFASETELETLNKIKRGQIPDLKNHLDPNYYELANIVNRCLTTDKTFRFQNGQDLSDAISKFLSVHFPEFNKHIFSDYLKNTFYHSYEKSEEKLDHYSQLKIEINEEPIVSPPPILVNHEDLKAALALKDLEAKKDLTWMYGTFILVITLLFYIVAYEIPRTRNKKTDVVLTNTMADSFKHFEIAFDNINHMIAVGSQACIQTESRKTFCWGDNRFHQLGAKSNKDYLHLTELKTFPNWETLDIGLFHSCGITKIKKDSQDWMSLQCWGDNSYGQIGDPAQQNVATPTNVDPNTQYKAISVGLYHTCGLTVDGTAKCWGRGESAQLGLSNIKSSKVPLIVDQHLRFKTISSGSYHTCGILFDDTLRCWGRSDYGQIGAGAIDHIGSIHNVDPKTKYSQIDLGDYHTCGTTTNNHLKCWGKNDFGQIGIGTQPIAMSPKLVSQSLKFKKVKTGRHHSCGQTLDDDLYCWGRNNYFQVSNKSETQFSTPEFFTKIVPTSEFMLGEFSTCFSLPRKLNCRGFHWIQNTRSPAEAD